MELRQLKIHCENWWWNRKLQIHLQDVFGVNWGYGKKAPFNSRRRGDYLFVIQNPENKTWWFMWGTKGDFDDSPLEATTAKTLLHQLIIGETNVSCN